MLTKLFFVLALTTLAHADIESDWGLAEEDVYGETYGEARLLDSVFNNTSIGKKIMPKKYRTSSFYVYIFILLTNFGKTLSWGSRLLPNLNFS